MTKPSTLPTAITLSEDEAYKLYKREEFPSYFSQTADVHKGAERTEHGEMAWDKTLSLYEAYKAITPAEVQMLTGRYARMFGSQNASTEQPTQVEVAKKKL